MPKYEPWTPERASEIIARYRHLEGATLPILQALQETFGCVPDEAVPLVAEALNLSRAEIHGTVTFYHDFRKVAGRPARAEAVPRRILPGRRRRCAGRARRSEARRGDGRDHAR